MYAQPTKTVLEPLKLAQDTSLIRELTESGAPVEVYMNSMVIAGREPVIVDTGTYANREVWQRQVYELVDPEDVRWIFLSHDDHDHTGNLIASLERSPNATLVTNAFTVERLSRDYEIPLQRMRWVNDGDLLDVGDRTLMIVRPPLFDGPGSLGTYDPRTGVYWSVDCFGVTLTEAIEDANEMPVAEYQENAAGFAAWLSPWHRWLDPKRHAEAVERVAALGATTFANAHGPAVRGERIEHALEVVRNAADLEPAVYPGQADLEQIMAVATAAPVV